MLEAVARHLATVPGRKNLVWISSGFPTVVSSRYSDLLPDFTPRMEETARVLTDANLAFYAVDARGLLGGFPGMSLSSINMVPNIGSPPFFSPIPPRAPVPTQASSPQTMVSLETWSLDGTDAFDRLANLTGGRTFSNSNGIEDSIQSALDDAALDYTLGFYPSEAVQKPNWHKLKVRVDQRGVRVRYREKYFASPTEASDDTRRALPALLKDPLDATQLQLVAQASPDQERPGCPKFRFPSTCMVFTWRSRTTPGWVPWMFRSRWRGPMTRGSSPARSKSQTINLRTLLKEACRSPVPSRSEAESASFTWSRRTAPQERPAL